MASFGGGGTACEICTKTAYPAETVSFEKKYYHADCFKCSVCSKKLTAAQASVYEDVIYCHHDFQKGGFAQKQKNTVWVKKESSGGSAAASKFGGGGNPCKICNKTVYAAETLSFEKNIYHPACFKCKDCGKKMTAAQASQFEDDLFCRKCFAAGGYTQKQTQTAKQGWVPKENASGGTSKFGGGGTKCSICTKTVYAAETVSFEKNAYHPACFKCIKCEKKMTPSGANYWDAVDDEGTELGRELLCTKCFGDGGYRQKQASVKKGASSTTADPRFAKFGGGSNPCERCQKSVFPAEAVAYEGKQYHGACLTCEGEDCGKKLTPATAEYHKGTNSIHCKACFQQKGLHRADA